MAATISPLTHNSVITPLPPTDTHCDIPLSGDAIAERILILAPTGRDAALACSVLMKAGLQCEECADVYDLNHKFHEGAGAVLIAEEALTASSIEQCRKILEHQPPWSDLPLIVLTHVQSTMPGDKTMALMQFSGNVTLLERPIRIVTLVSMMQVALRARRRQYQVRDLLCQLEDGVRQRDEFLAMLGHELRNPLSTIRNSVAVLNQLGPASAETMQQRSIIERQSRHLAHLIDDLLDVSRITQGKIHLQLEPVDLNDVMERALQAQEGALREQNHTLTLSLAPEPVVVNGDAVRLEQIVSNLLTNAIKYTPPGGHIWATVAREPRGDHDSSNGSPPDGRADLGEAIVTVRDNGTGIAPELKSGIFDLFKQAEHSLDRTKGGLGIGLTVVRRLVEMHGGTVTVSSDGPGHGCEFTIRLPLTASLPATAEPPRRPSSAAARRILLVEDNPDARLVLQMLLKLKGHQVEIAEDGPQGITRARETHPEIALIDLGLPGLNGYDVARELRAEFGKAIYLVALTGYGQPDDRANALKAGFDMHLTKPVDPDHLNQVLSLAPGIVP